MAYIIADPGGGGKVGRAERVLLAARGLMEPLIRVAALIAQGFLRFLGLVVAVGIIGMLVLREAGQISRLWDLPQLVVFLSALTHQLIVRVRSGGAERRVVDTNLLALLAAALVAVESIRGMPREVSEGLVYGLALLGAAVATHPVTAIVPVALVLLADTVVPLCLGHHHSALVAVTRCLLVLAVAVGTLAVARRTKKGGLPVARSVSVAEQRPATVQRTVSAPATRSVSAPEQRPATAQRAVSVPVARSVSAAEQRPVTAQRTVTNPAVSSTSRNNLPPLVDPGFAPQEERPMVSAVEGIRLLLSLLLDFVRQNLALDTAALYWVDPAGQKLELSRVSPLSDATWPASLGYRDGMVGASISRRIPLSVTGPSASRHACRSPSSNPGGICAVPVLDADVVVGVLVVDRVAATRFSDDEVGLLVRTAELIVRSLDNERVSLHLERSKLEQHKLYRAVGQLASASTEAEVIEAGVDGARQFAAFDCAVVTLFDRHRREHEICAASGEGFEALVGQRFAQDSSLVSMVVENRHPLPYRCEYDPERQPVFGRSIPCPYLPSLLVLPLSEHDRTLGTLVLGSRQRGAFVGAVQNTLEVLAAHLAVSLSNARMLKRLEELATLDGLTGLLNKRALLECTQQKLRSAERFGKPLSVLICDIDFFKKVNDTYGHDMGDIVLRGFAQILGRIKRDTDVVGRFGGEEFVIVCEQTNEKGALLLAERVRVELEAATFATPQGPLQVTCSVGVATFPPCGRTWEQLFKSADDALYVSKRSGRNRVTAGRLGAAQSEPAVFATRMDSRAPVRHETHPS